MVHFANPQQCHVVTSSRRHVFTVMMKLIPDPRGQGEGDEGGEEGALAGAVRQEHTWNKDLRFHATFSEVEETLAVYENSRIEHLRTDGRLSNLKEEM